MLTAQRKDHKDDNQSKGNGPLYELERQALSILLLQPCDDAFLDLKEQEKESYVQNEQYSPSNDTDQYHFI